MDSKFYETFCRIMMNNGFGVLDIIQDLVIIYDKTFIEARRIAEIAEKLGPLSVVD